MSENYCGCCGRVRISADDHFCTRCLAHCLPPGGQSAENRTWFAQYGTDCPFTEARR